MVILKETELAGEWTDKNGLIKRYKHLNRSTLNHWLSEMRATNEFRQFITNPTSKLVWIHVKGFHEFLLYKQRKNYK